MSFSILRRDIPDYAELCRRRERGALHALDQLIIEKLARGPKTRKELVVLGKAQEFTPADVRNCIDRLCHHGTATHDTNEKGAVLVRLAKGGK